MALPPRSTLSQESEEKLRSRVFRLRFQNIQKLWLPLKIAASSALLIGLSYFAITQLKYLFFETTYFELRSIEVVGNKRLTRDSVVAASGVTPGVNVLKLDRDEVRTRVSQLPLVKKADTGLSGLYTLKIFVEERESFIYAKVGTRFFEICTEGVLVTTETQLEKNLPIVTGLNLEGKQPGDSLTSHDGYLEAASWIRVLSPAILAKISELNFSNVQNPYIFLLSGEKIFPRSVEDFNERFDFLCTLLDNLRKNNVEPRYLDMRAPNNIVVRPVSVIRVRGGGR